MRSIFVHDASREGEHRVYEERVRLFAAPDADAGIARGEVEAAEYAGYLDDCTALGLHQSFESVRRPGDGAEVFSLCGAVRWSRATTSTDFFDTGTERQGRVG
ncbi:hypothetical protein G5V59_10840 [Nocardioides sp. W3-2-3]|uniref:hypothetical protein n=1 Tax=Nocardioides convexus TaxID=2712224 RepID=UPI002418803B|nr:hypothetical protein [Nocardioides convexus]NHA00403.1 hypothetical protein [Nocardioides convexus]